MTSDQAVWLVARASGITAYVLLTFVVLAGLLLKARPFGTVPKPAAVVDVHRFLSLLTLGALGAHGTALVLDTKVEIPLQALVVPGLIGYRPAWTAAGVLAGLGTALLVVSFSLRRRIGTRVWRALHYAAFPVFAAASAHGIMAGTDSGRPWAVALYIGAVAAVVAATAWRILVPPPGRRRPAPPPAAGRTPTNALTGG
jgi:sulfoxide reductase heme-binding subunit YedZ